MRLLVVANPYAKHGRARGKLKEILAALSGFSHVEWLVLRSAEHAIDVVAAADLSAISWINHRTEFLKVVPNR